MKILRNFENWETTKFLSLSRKEEDISTIIFFRNIKNQGVFAMVLSCGFYSSVLISRTFLPTCYDQEDLEFHNITKIFSLSDAVDSLVLEVNLKVAGRNNIQGVISQGNKVALERGRIVRKGISGQEKLLNESDGTKSIVQEFDSVPLNISNSEKMAPLPSRDTYLSTLLKDDFTTMFQSKKVHFGVDVATKGDELVKAIADGRVILEAWTFETEFIIGIQHSNELPPVSKHNSVVLKNTDDLVSGGEIISISGDSGKLSIGQHLDFELWNKNNLINPQQFITFI